MSEAPNRPGSTRASGPRPKAMALDEDVDRLSRVPLFSHMEGPALRLLAFAAERRAVPAGEPLFRAGENAPGAILVLSGTLLLARPDESEPRVLGPGALLGSFALVTPVTHRSSATAREPATVLDLARSAFMRALDEYPASAFGVRRHLARRLARRLQPLKR